MQTELFIFFYFILFLKKHINIAFKWILFLYPSEGFKVLKGWIHMQLIKCDD